MDKFKTNQIKSKKTLSDTSSFIETQLPVAKISMESYKERKSGRSQTITGLGRWWGRKPLILVRAALLGLILPSSKETSKDREVFEKLLTLDREGLALRKDKSIPKKRLLEELSIMSPSIRARFLDPQSSINRAEIKPNLNDNEKRELQYLVFNRMPYDEKLRYCVRPEQISGPSEEAWREINEHLGTKATNLEELIQELGDRKFGKLPTIGDAFCGGGSIPFEAARIGFNSYGSDLNPVAAFLSWAALNVIGGEEEQIKKIPECQNYVYDKVESQIKKWGIEENSLGWRAEAYLYCTEVVDPENDWKIPLSPSWVIAEKNNVVAKLIPDESNKRFDIEIIEGVSNKELAETKRSGTLKNNRLIPPQGGESTPIEVIRQNMRLWKEEDWKPLPDDVFQERLFCIRWVETYIDDDGKEQIRRHYRAPTIEDSEREKKVQLLVGSFFKEWQEKGYIPSKKIRSGYNTDQPIRERGWRYWHQLFNYRHLLLNGLIAKECLDYEDSQIGHLVHFLTFSTLAQKNSQLCRWRSGLNKSGGIGAVEDAFANQALNTIYNPPARGILLLRDTILRRFPHENIAGKSKIMPRDARAIDELCEIWVTDPPYADAINYEEISEYFLSWYEKHLPNYFLGWYSDTKRALAVKGNDVDFRISMVESYKRLCNHMPDDGLQVVMFTHQDAAVWADLSTILWASGLRVTAAWTIATETDSALKQGNYVQGTVLLVLRKRIESEPVFLDEINHRVESEVKIQLNSMLALEDKSDPNFGDADYQLAAYAAALRVLTERPIYEIDPEKEVLRERQNGEISPVEYLIRSAVKIACDHLVPKGFDGDLWKGLSPMERFYLKGVEVESHGEYRNGVYQELARGFGAVDYTDMLSSTKANETRLNQPSEFGRRNLSGEGFGGTLVRQCLFGIYQVVKGDEVNSGLNWFRTELPDYWTVREKIIRILEYLATIGNVRGMEHWKKDAHAASLLAGAVRNDHV